MRLWDALRPHPALCLAFTGGGGKTTALFRAGREYLAGAAGPALLTTTTHLALEQAGRADAHLILETPAALEAWIDSQTAGLPGQVLLFTGPVIDDGRLSGLSFAALEQLRRLAADRGLPLLIEADGSRRRPLKAPADHEPAVPDGVDAVVVLAGLSGLGQPLSAENVHRPERFATLAGIHQGDLVTPQALERVLAHPQGGLQGLPPGARRIALLNQADTPELQALGSALAKRLLGPYAAGMVASLQTSGVHVVHERLAGIVLAGGGSARMGQPKQVLAWRGRPLVWHAARAALLSGLDPVVVVTGHAAGQVQAALQGLPVQFAHNPAWEAGQSASVIAGLQALPPDCGGALFLLADQPQVSPELIRALAEAHAADLAPLTAPLVDGRRANPVLFDRVTFPDLLALTGDTGGRALFSRYRVAWVPWLDSQAALDVDTPEDYRRLVERDGPGAPQ